MPTIFQTSLSLWLATPIFPAFILAYFLSISGVRRLDLIIDVAFMAAAHSSSLEGHDGSLTVSANMEYIGSSDNSHDRHRELSRYTAIPSSALYGETHDQDTML